MTKEEAAVYLKEVHATLDKIWTLSPEGREHSVRVGAAIEILENGPTTSRLRPVRVFKLTKNVWGIEGDGVFHGFSQDHEEYDNGPGMFPVAIVEFPDGRVIAKSLSTIQFMDRETK